MERREEVTNKKRNRDERENITEDKGKASK
jgi:hypothetical protein